MLETTDYEPAAETLAILANNGESYSKASWVKLKMQLANARAQIIKENGIAILVGMLSGKKSRSGARVLQTLMKHGGCNLSSISVLHSGFN